MNKISCDMCIDLMPLVQDGVASEDSRSYIEEHTAQCPACKKLYIEMCDPMEQTTEDRTEDVLKRVYRKQRRVWLQLQQSQDAYPLCHHQQRDRLGQEIP